MINYQFIDSAFGDITLVCNQTHLIGLLFGHTIESRYTRRLAKISQTNLKDWHQGSCSIIDDARSQLTEYTKGKRKQFDVPVELLGSDFQISVWQALLTIPHGEVRSYQHIANAIGRPSAVRAVANANGANALAIIVPCHRVISSDGSLGGYSGGIEKKQAMLKIEGTDE